MKKYPLLIILMTPLYMMLKGNFSPTSFLEGVFFSSIALLLTRTVVKPEVKQTFLGLLKRLLPMIIYITYVLIESIVSTLDLIYRCLHPRLPIYPKILPIKISKPDDIYAVMISIALNLSPGTLTIDVQSKQKTIILHTINAKDIEKIRKRIQNIEKYVARVLE